MDHLLVGEDDHGEQALSLASQDVGGKLDQVVALLHRLADLYQRLEALAFQLDRVDPDVHQDLQAFVAAHGHGVAGGMHLHHGARAWGQQDLGCGIDGDAVSHHFLGKDGIRDGV